MRRSIAASMGVRVRYAPSPTGDLHLGGLRTALFNYLFAQNVGGEFILRIEDTDKTREVEGSLHRLVADLKWCGLDYDEGPVTVPDASHPDGFTVDRLASADTIQSGHLDRFRDAADRLLDSGHAYRCFCSADRLARLREHQSSKGAPTLYDRACAGLDPAEAAARAAAGEPHTVRLLVPTGTTNHTDEVLGSVSFNNAVVDDQVLMKSDGFPTYHLAAVVDDAAMEVSHVIRGQEWLSSTPKHLLLYKALEYDIPKFVHLPLLLNHDKSKLSKRKGDVAVSAFRDEYLPDALLNFVALLGWNPKDEREVFDREELVAAFSLPAVNKGNSIVDRKRLDWLNGQHIRRVITSDGAASRQTSQAQLQATVAERLKAHMAAATKPPPSSSSSLPSSSSSAGMVSVDDDPQYLADIVALQHERVSRVSEFVPLLAPFYMDPNFADPETRSIKADVWDPTPGVTDGYLSQAVDALSAVDDDNATGAGFGKAGFKALKSVAKANKTGPKHVMLPFRVAVTGLAVGASITDVMSRLGRDTCVRRLRLALEAQDS